MACHSRSSEEAGKISVLARQSCFQEAVKLPNNARNSVLLSCEVENAHDKLCAGVETYAIVCQHHEVS